MRRSVRSWRTGMGFVLVVFVLVGSAAVMYGQGDCTACSDPTEQESFSAWIRNTETGEVVQLPIKRRVRMTRVNGQVRSNEVEYVVEILSDSLRSSLTRESRTDASISYRITLTQYYDEFYDNGSQYLAVSRYTGKWESLDPQVRATEGYLRAGVNGPVWGGGYFLYRSQDSPHFAPGTYATRTLTPSWAGTYVVVNDYGFYQCGQIGAELERVTGHTWEFWFNICKGTIWPPT